MSQFLAVKTRPALTPYYSFGAWENMLYESLNIPGSTDINWKAKAHCFQHSFLHISSFSVLILSFTGFHQFWSSENFKRCFGSLGTFLDAWKIIWDDSKASLKTLCFLMIFHENIDPETSLKDLTLWYQISMDLGIWHCNPHWNNILLGEKTIRTQTNGWIFRNCNFLPPNYSRCLNFKRIRLGQPWRRITLFRAQEICSTSHYYSQDTRTSIWKRKRIAFSTHFFIFLHFLC